MIIIVIIYSMMVGLISSNDRSDFEITQLKPEEINTPVECNPGFNGTISCYLYRNSHITRCTVHCTSSDWTYFYLTNTNCYDNKTITTYVSPMNPMKISVNTENVKCSDGYNMTKLCFSKRNHLSYIILGCKVNCTSNKGYYVYETDMIYKLNSIGNMN